MIQQFQENARAEGQTEGRKDEQTLFYRTLLSTAGGPIMNLSQQGSYI